MSFAEIILRVVGSIGGWLIFIGYALTLAVLRRVDCDPQSDELWRGTLFFGGVSLLGLAFVGQGLIYRDSIRWFSIPAAGLALYAAIGIFPAFSATTIGAESLCIITNMSAELIGGENGLPAIKASTLERGWPVFQMIVLLAGIFQASRYWIGSPTNKGS